MEILGHSQITLTMNTYSHVAPEISSLEDCADPSVTSGGPGQPLMAGPVSDRQSPCEPARPGTLGPRITSAVCREGTRRLCPPQDRGPGSGGHLLFGGGIGVAGREWPEECHPVRCVGTLADGPV
jgi:hypothetical protein